MAKAKSKTNAKSKTKRKTRRNKSQPSAISQAVSDMKKNISEWFEEHNVGSRLLRSGLIVILLFVIVGVIGFSLDGLENYVNRLPIFTASEVSVSLHKQPSWMSDALAKEILKDSFLPLQEQLRALHRQGHDNELSKVLAYELRQNPWVQKSIWIRRGFGGKVVINAEFREPVAMVNLDGGCYLIDNAGHRLPGKYKYDALLECGLLEIHGVKGSVPDAGKAWLGGDLKAGLDLVTRLKSAPFRHQIKCVDVTNFAGRCDPNSCWIILETDRNTIIRWGRPVGEERGLEILARDKLANLAGAYVDYCHIDCGRNYIDVRRLLNGADASIASVGDSMSD